MLFCSYLEIWSWIHKDSVSVLKQCVGQHCRETDHQGIKKFKLLLLL